MRLLLLLVPGLTAVLGGAAFADEVSTPDSVASSYLSTMIEEGMGSTGRYFDPEALAGLKDVFVALLEIEAGQQKSQLRAAMFGSDASLQDAAGMPPAAFYAGIMRFFELQMQQANVRFSTGKVLGTVYENPELAHVVARVDVRLGEDSMSSIDTISMRRAGEAWVLLPSAEVEEFANAIRAQISRSP